MEAFFNFTMHKYICHSYEFYSIKLNLTRFFLYIYLNLIDDYDDHQNWDRSKFAIQIFSGEMKDYKNLALPPPEYNIKVLTGHGLGVGCGISYQVRNKSL